MLNIQRPRRNRKSEAIRSLVEETKVSTDDLLFPLFLIDGTSKKVEVASMPGIYRFTLDLMLKEIEECLKLGIKAFDVFPAVEDSFKDGLHQSEENKNGKKVYSISHMLYTWTLQKIK